MRRRSFLQGLAISGAAGALPLAPGGGFANSGSPVGVDALPALQGELTLYLGRGEGGLYENVLAAIEQRNPDLRLQVRRGPTAALANAVIAEAEAGVRRADVFWAVDSGAIGMINGAGLARDLPDDLVGQLQPGFRYRQWVPVTGRIRTLPFNTEKLSTDRIPSAVMALSESGLDIGWAPAYASFQSFITAMRLLEGEQATLDWLRGIQQNATSYAGELGVVMGVERGEVQLGFANHYYTLRLRSGMPTPAWTWPSPTTTPAAWSTPPAFSRSPTATCRSTSSAICSPMKCKATSPIKPMRFHWLPVSLHRRACRLSTASNLPIST